MFHDLGPRRFDLDINSEYQNEHFKEEMFYILIWNIKMNICEKKTNIDLE